jgi:hypothetical protein
MAYGVANNESSNIFEARSNLSQQSRIGLANVPINFDVLVITVGRTADEASIKMRWRQ